MEMLFPVIVIAHSTKRHVLLALLLLLLLFAFVSGGEGGRRIYQKGETWAEIEKVARSGMREEAYGTHQHAACGRVFEVQTYSR